MSNNGINARLEKLSQIFNARAKVEYNAEYGWNVFIPGVFKCRLAGETNIYADSPVGAYKVKTIQQAISQIYSSFSHGTRLVTSNHQWGFWMDVDNYGEKIATVYESGVAGETFPYDGRVREILEQEEVKIKGLEPQVA